MWLVILLCSRDISLQTCIVSEASSCHSASEKRQSKMVEIDLCNIFEGRKKQYLTVFQLSQVITSQDLDLFQFLLHLGLLLEIVSLSLFCMKCGLLFRTSCTASGKNK